MGVPRRALRRSLGTLYDALDVALGLQVGEVGTASGSGVSVVESGSDALHKTTFTLTDVPVPITSVTTGAGVGGLLIYTFPVGYIQRFGCVGNLSISVDAAEQDNFTDGTPEGDIGIGSAAPADADALGTDAADDDWGTAAAYTMTAFEDTDVNIAPEAGALVDRNSSAAELYINALVDAADIDDGVTTEVLVSGTLTVTWAHLGSTA